MSLHKSLKHMSWMLEEALQKNSTPQIYNDLVAKNQYEMLVDYANRVKGFSYVLSHVSNKYSTVLDIACGTGAFIDALAHKQTVKVLGIDISQGMLYRARRRFQKFSNITFKRESIFDASFPKESFDLITFSHATRFIPPEKEQEFARRVTSWLSRDGTFVVIITTSSFMNVLRFISKLSGFPRGFNITMQDTVYFIQAMRAYFSLEKEIVINTEYKVFKNIALYFRKKQ